MKKEIFPAERLTTGQSLSITGFNGEYQDGVLHQYILGNGYRAYNPALQRFTSPDSMSPFGQGGINPYIYCEGDPINNTDPTGHAFLFDTLGIMAFRWIYRGAEAAAAASADTTEAAVSASVVGQHTIADNSNVLSEIARITDITEVSASDIQEDGFQEVVSRKKRQKSKTTPVSMGADAAAARENIANRPRLKSLSGRRPALKQGDVIHTRTPQMYQTDHPLYVESVSREEGEKHRRIRAASITHNPSLPPEHFISPGPNDNFASTPGSRPRVQTFPVVDILSPEFARIDSRIFVFSDDTKRKISNSIIRNNERRRTGTF